jgi:hypothetical protein
VFVKISRAAATSRRFKPAFHGHSTRLLCRKSAEAELPSVPVLARVHGATLRPWKRRHASQTLVGSQTAHAAEPPFPAAVERCSPSFADDGSCLGLLEVDPRVGREQRCVAEGGFISLSFVPALKPLGYFCL